MLVTGAYPAATADAIANLLNVTPRWVRQLAKEGVIPKPERGKYDLTGAVQGYVKYLQARAEGRGVEGQDVHAARARVRKAELEIAALERSLLPFDEVVTAWQQLVAAFRAKCLALPSKMAPRLAMSETREIQPPSPPPCAKRSRSFPDSTCRAIVQAARVASLPPAVTVRPEDSGEHGQHQSIKANYDKAVVIRTERTELPVLHMSATTTRSAGSAPGVVQVLDDA